uniref:DUF4408 domain-containing protein n=1 Tax=Schrenkiella parvula TaxID=98039 RepID=E5F728_9BRAS|nr:unknown [Schrenkiella parvula]
MDFDNVKAEKAKALRRYNRFRRVGRFFRAAEVCVAVLFLFWTFTRLPFAVQIFGEFLRRLAGVISTPLFVFLLGNCIVVVLLTKSSDQTTGGSANAETEVYQAFLSSVENRSNEGLADEIVYDDKQVIVTETNIPHDEDDRVEVDSHKVYGRSKSDVSANDRRVVIKKPCLRRSETEKCRNSEKDKNYPEDNLSNEEFQKTIEAFIAKQLMFRRQESLAVVVHNIKA